MPALVPRLLEGVKTPLAGEDKRIVTVCVCEKFRSATTTLENGFKDEASVRVCALLAPEMMGAEATAVAVTVLVEFAVVWTVLET